MHNMNCIGYWPRHVIHRSEKNSTNSDAESLLSRFADSLSGSVCFAFVRGRTQPRCKLEVGASGMVTCGARSTDTYFAVADLSSHSACMALKILDTRHRCSQCRPSYAQRECDAGGSATCMPRPLHFAAPSQAHTEPTSSVVGEASAPHDFMAGSQIFEEIPRMACGPAKGPRGTAKSSA